MQHVLDKDPLALREEINELAAKLARVARLVSPPGMKFYLPPEENGGLVNHEVPMYWQMAVAAYEHVYEVDVAMILQDYFSQGIDENCENEGVTVRMCPKTGVECEHLAGCNHINACNKPVPIAEFIQQSPENAALIENVKEGLRTGTLHLS